MKINRTLARPLILLPVVLLLAACSGGYSTGMSAGYAGQYDPFYDYYYRGGIYSHHVPPYGGNRPDRPRPPIGVGPNRPMALPGRLPPRLR
jgi:hypothetical protein